jgi:hypothetical protein
LPIATAPWPPNPAMIILVSLIKFSFPVNRDSLILIFDI